MRTLLLVALLSLLTPAYASMHDAIAASALLTDVADARTVRITLSAPLSPGGPSEIYGTVFNFEGYAWFYAAETANRVLGPGLSSAVTPAEVVGRLRKVGVPAASAVIYPRSPPPPLAAGQVKIPNACVIGALVTLEQRLLGNAGVNEAGLVLLSYQTDDADRTSAMVVDHCVLVFREREGWHCIDPRTPDTVVKLEQLRVGSPIDSALMAMALRSRYPLRSARLLSLSASTLEQIRTTALWRLQRKSVEAAL